MTDITVFTVFRRTRVGILGADGSRQGTEEREERYTMPARDALNAVGDLLASFADDDPRLDDLTPEDDEYDSEYASALDDVEGIFAAYAGELTDRPEADPLYEEGCLGDPTHWERKKPAAA